jgi:hypothetical protein
MGIGSQVRLEAETRKTVRERDIRGPLERWLLHVHRDQPDTTILHELEIPRPSARIDVAAINGRLAGYEIKSEADRLDRLGRQAPSFSLVFERMSVVTTKKHAATVASYIPDWWGIVVWGPSGFRTKRRGKLNRQINMENLFHMLSRTELLKVEWLAFGKNGPFKARKAELVGRLLRHSRQSRLLGAVRTVLKERSSL